MHNLTSLPNLTFHQKMKIFIEKEFPDTEDTHYFVSKKLLGKRPWVSRHVILVHKDWRRKEKCFLPNTWWTASVAFDNREKLGLPAIKIRINTLSMLWGVLVPTNHL